MVRGDVLTERGGTKVEIAAVSIIVQIGIEPQETAEMHQEDEMEIGEIVLTLVQPFDAVVDIVKQGLVLLFVSQSVVKKLTDEQADGHFRIVGL